MPPGNSRLIASLFAVYAVVLVTVVAAGVGGIALVDGVRAYAMGESYYTKGQRSAVLALHRYAHARDPADFAAYERAIAVPVNGRRAREVLEDRSRPAAESHAFLEGGGNHPDDVATLAWFFRLFSETALFREPLETWRRADAKIAELEAAAQVLRRTVRSGRTSEAELMPHLRRIDALDADLATLELAFARGMGEAARSLRTLLGAGIGGLGAVLGLIAAGFTVHATRRIRTANANARQRQERFRDVVELAADWVWETDAAFRITYLSDRIETVTQLPKERFLGRRRWDLGDGPDPEGWGPHIATMERHEAFRAFEYTLTTEAGARHFRISGNPVHAADGTFLGYRGTGTDVTAEVAARREAEARRELLETTFENLSQGVSVADAELNVVFFNRRFLELLNFPPDRFAIGDPFEKFIRHNAERGEYGDGDIDALVRERVEQARRFEPHRFERTRPDGTVIAVRGQPLPSGGFVSTYRDITLERRMQTALEASEARLRAVIDGALDAIVTIDAEGRITEFNAAAERILGWPRDTAIGRPLADLVVPERYREAHLAGLARHLETGGSDMLGRQVELTALRADGSEIPVELSITAGMAGGARIFTGFLRDMTARREAEAARREAERLLWAVLEASPDSISLKDTAGRYLLCNAAFERFTGVSRDRVRGRTDADVFGQHPDNLAEVAAHERLVLETRAPAHQEREEPDGEGRIRTRSITKFPTFDADGRPDGIGTFNQDITELKQAERQLRQAVKMQAVGQLTGGVAHDFNNLLAVVLGNLELLREGLDSDPARAGLAERALAAAQRGATITRRLLAFARQQPLQPQAVDVAALLDSMADLLRQSVGESVALELRVAEDVQPCFVDPSELEATLLNLAVNARDAMPDGGRLTVEVANGATAEWEAAEVGAGTATGEPAAADPADFVVFTVSDTGTGMSEEVLTRAFEPFFTTKSPEKGSGLGLSMVYGFARQSGGHVTIRSAPGEGATVQLCLPRAIGEGALAAPGETGADAARGRGECILVAEDDDLVREHVAAQLDRLGYRVTAVSDGPRALGILEGGAVFDLLLADIVMPGGLSGFELADAARRQRPAMPVLFTSGYLEGGLPGDQRLAPGLPFLRKPYRRAELARQVRLALDGGACEEAGCGEAACEEAAATRPKGGDAQARHREV